MTIEAICNQALDLIGYKRHIGYIYEGTLAARIALDVWGTTRDTLLVAREWDFALYQGTLANTGLVPMNYWAAEYYWPADALAIRAVYPIFKPTDPAPVRFDLDYDTRLSTNVILSTEAAAYALYTGRTLDPTKWRPEFVSLFVETLAREFDAGLGKHDTGRSGQSSAG